LERGNFGHAALQVSGVSAHEAVRN